MLWDAPSTLGDGPTEPLAPDPNRFRGRVPPAFPRHLPRILEPIWIDGCDWDRRSAWVLHAGQQDCRDCRPRRNDYRDEIHPHREHYSDDGIRQQQKRWQPKLCLLKPAG